MTIPAREVLLSILGRLSSLLDVVLPGRTNSGSAGIALVRAAPGPVVPLGGETGWRSVGSSSAFEPNPNGVGAGDAPLGEL